MRQMTLQDIQQVSLDILKDIHEFCIANDIKYTLFSGTLIGAIRHKGFIPWDDDLDIAMPRPDYERFVRLYGERNGFKCFSPEIQGENVWIAFARVCDMKRTFVDDSFILWTKEDKGVWIDIFPLDGAPSDRIAAEKLTEKIYKEWDLTRKIRLSWDRHIIRKTLRMTLGHLKNKILNSWKGYEACARHIALCKTIPFESATHYSNFSWPGWKMREYCEKDVLSEYILWPFEDQEFYVMKGYDKALRAKYGDYMTPPPASEQSPRHSMNHFYWKD